jgi:hypothetical protein
MLDGIYGPFSRSFTSTKHIHSSLRPLHRKAFMIIEDQNC